MKNLKKFIIPAVAIAVALVFVIYIFAKGESKQNKFMVDPEFAEYVSAVTSGVISCESTIKVMLVEPYKGDSGKKDEVIKNIFSFSPSIDGTARWSDDRTIEFIPDKKLKSGETYNATFNLGKILKVPSKFSEMNFGFRIIKQDFLVNEDGLTTYPNQADKYSLSGEIKTADVIDNALIEKVLKANISGKNLEVRWEHNSNRINHVFIIDSIPRTAENQTLALAWNGGAVDIEQTGSLNIEIPAAGIYKVLDARQMYSPEQYIKIIFSDPLRANQDLNGIITLNNSRDLRFEIENNIVKVYTDNSSNLESYRLVVSNEVLNYKGERLPERFVKEINYQQINPAVEIIGRGTIMPNSGKIILPFRSVNVKAVDIEVVKIFEKNVPQFLQVNQLNGMYELQRVGRPILRQKIDLTSDHALDYSVWNNFSVDLSKLIKTEPGALYRITFSIKKSYSLYPCEPDTTENDNAEAEENWDDNQRTYNDWDEGEYYYSYDWENRDNPCKNAYYQNRERRPSCNVLASNIGIVGKVNKNNEVNVVVTDLIDAKPISGAKVDILDYQQQVIGSVTTNSDGFATYTANHAPYLIIVRNNSELGYLSLSGGSSLSLSTFDVGGEQVQKGLKGFIYGERGVWRPGDTLFLTFILEDKNKTLPENHPVIFELTDPKGRLYKRLVKSNGVNGFYTFTIPTEDKVPTGFWNINVRTGGAVFSKSIRIESIKPNRLEITLDLTGKKQFVEKNVQGKLNAQWLHGAIASNLKARITATLTKMTTTFKKFPDFVFDDATKNFSSDEQVIFEGLLDENGNANINTTLKSSSDAPGFLKASFITKVFEDGGDFSIDYYSVPFSPYSIYTGIKTPKNQWGYDAVYIDSAYTFKVASVTQDGIPVSRDGLKVAVYEMSWRWWWDASDNDIATYFANSYKSPVFSQTVSTVDGFGSFKLKLDHEGRYLAKITDPAGHSCSQVFYADWPWWRARTNTNERTGATILNIAPDKQKYTVGEKATITLPAGNKGRALVSIESGSKIISMSWMDLKESKDNKPVIEIPITAEMAPNVFVNVTLLQPHANTQNDMPIRLYGYTPILVEDPSTILEPVMSLPDQIASEEQFTITVKEQKGKPMTYTLAIVDEGLLGITRFKTPNPHGTFYAREALGIKTWDMFDLVFGAFGGKIEQIFGIGGDQELGGMKGQKNAERYKPVVKFLGPFTLAKGGTNTHTVKLPKYNGAVRAMIVGGQDGAYGIAEKTVRVKNALMAVATLPRVLGPGETVDMPVNIFADDASIKSVQVQVQSNSLLVPSSETTKTVTFNKPGNTTVNFSFKVASSLGVAKVKVTATSGNHKADYDIELNVRNPNSPEVDFSGTLLQGGQSFNKDLTMIGMTGTNKAIIEVSSLPPLDLSRHLDYLISYPHGCIEQTTSGIFPQLYLDKVMFLTSEKRNKVETNVKAGLERLKLFQLSDGSFSYWPGENYYSEWGTNYAGHFILEAEKEGYKLPAGMKQSWVKFQQSRARNWTWSSGMYWGDELDQAYRLYTLALAGEPEMGAMNRLREKANLSDQAKWRLAATYEIVGQDEVAKQLINNLSTTVKEYAETGFTFGSDLRDEAMILETFSLMKDYKRGSIVAEAISKRLSNELWFSTQTLAYCLVAFSEFSGKSGLTNENLNFSYSFDGTASQNVSSKSAIYQLEPDVKNKSKINVNIVNKNKSNLYLRIYLEGIPLAGKETDAASNLGLDVAYKDTKGNTINPEQIKQGTDFKVLVTVKNTGQFGYYYNLALTQIFPSGWEIINTRLGQADASSQADNFEYQDIRDDRVMTYFNLSTNQTKTFTITVNSTYRGEFYLPVIKCEAMYDNRIYARKTGKWVKVE